MFGMDLHVGMDFHVGMDSLNPLVANGRLRADSKGEPPGGRLDRL